MKGNEVRMPQLQEAAVSGGRQLIPSIGGIHDCHLSNKIIAFGQAVIQDFHYGGCNRSSGGAN
jgi:hypothetical protein